MPLPTVIASGTSFSQNETLPPFLDSNENVWVITRVTSSIRAYKATDPTSSWTLADTLNTSVNVSNMQAAQEGNIIHIAWVDANLSVRYVQYDTSTESFGTIESVATAATNGNTVGGVCVRSNGEVILNFLGHTDRIMGNDYRRLSYARRATNGTWTNAQVSSSSSQSHDNVGASILGAGDRVHFVWYFTLSGISERTLSSANVLGTKEDIFTTGSGWDIPSNHTIATWVDGADTRALGIIRNSSLSTHRSYSSVSSDDPTWTTNTNLWGTGYDPARYGLIAHGTVVYFLESGEDDTSIIFYRTNDNLAGWSARQTLYDHSALISNLVPTRFTRNGNVVLAYTFYSTDLYYNEFVLEAGAVTQTFTADSILLRSEAASFTANSILLRTESNTFAADAILVTSVSETFTADAILLNSVSATFTADAVLVREEIASFSADAILLRTENQTATADAVIQQVVSDTLTADAIILRSEAASFSADAIFKATVEANFTADSVLTHTETATFTADAALLSVVAASFTADSILKDTLEVSFTASAVLSKTFEASFTSDALLLRIEEDSITADAVILRTETPTFTADAVISVGAVQFTADAVLLREEIVAATADAILLAVVDNALTADAVLLRVESATFSADAILLGTITVTATADAVLLATVEATFTADGILLEVVDASFVADAILLASVSATATADAYIDVISRPVWTTPGNNVTINDLTPTLEFNMPSETSGDMHFMIEIDTVNTFNSGSYLVFTSYSDGTGWEYWDGAAWQPIPVSGVPSSFKGNAARYTLQSALTEGTWYRRVTGGV